MLIRQGPEIVVGLIGAVGTSLSEAVEAIESSLRTFGYASQVIELSSLLALTPEGKSIDRGDEQRRVLTSMDAGTNLRKRLGRGDALAALAVAEIVGQRRKLLQKEPNSTTPPSDVDRPKLLDNYCFILKSLKHEHEVVRLRELYREHFVCISVYSPRGRRVQDLSEHLADSCGGRASELRSQAELLIAKDEKEIGTRLGQSVREAYPLADAFVAADRMTADVDRVFELFFGSPLVTPQKDEQGMFLAQAAALRSGALARQVGACIATSDGDVLALGCNEAPRGGGGQYWAGDDPDGRDLALGHDRNDRIKQRLAREVLEKFQKSKWLVDGVKERPLADLVRAVLAKDGSGDELHDAPRLGDSLVGNLTEFGRDVHAEMSAITTMARLGRSAAGATMYCTTFPCHNCAKHIIAAGIPRVVYIEPYPKSFAFEFHSDALVIEGAPRRRGTESSFEPFSGVSPKRYLQWFQSGSRKTNVGDLREWSRVEAMPKVASFPQVDLDLEADFMSLAEKAIDATSDLPTSNSQ